MCVFNLRRLSMSKDVSQKLVPGPNQGARYLIQKKRLSGIPRASCGIGTDSWSPFPGFSSCLGAWPLWLSICHWYSRLVSLSRTRPSRFQTQTTICFPSRIICIPRRRPVRWRPRTAMANEVEFFDSLSTAQSFQNAKYRKVQTKRYYQKLQRDRAAPGVRGGVPSLLCITRDPRDNGEAPGFLLPRGAQVSGMFLKTTGCGRRGRPRMSSFWEPRCCGHRWRRWEAWRGRGGRSPSGSPTARWRPGRTPIHYSGNENWAQQGRQWHETLCLIIDHPFFLCPTVVGIVDILLYPLYPLSLSPPTSDLWSTTQTLVRSTQLSSFKPITFHPDWRRNILEEDWWLQTNCSVLNMFMGASLMVE